MSYLLGIYISHLYRNNIIQSHKINVSPISLLSLPENVIYIIYVAKNDKNNMHMCRINGNETIVCFRSWERQAVPNENVFLNPLIAGVEFIRVFIFYWHIKYHVLNMLMIKCDINQQDLKRVDRHFVKFE